MKATLLSNHVVLIHGKRGHEQDVVTLPELEKELEEKVEADVLEIRENQRRKSQGIPLGEKKPIPTATLHRQPRITHRATWDVEKTISENKSREEASTNEDSASKPQLASKLSQAYNNQTNMNIATGQVNSTAINQNYTNVPTGQTTNNNYTTQVQNNHFNNMLPLPGNFTPSQLGIPRTTSQSPPKGLLQYNDLSL